MRDAELVEDLTAEIFVQVIQSMPTFRIPTRDAVALFSDWLFRIAHNHLYRFYRRRRREEAIALPDEGLTEGIDPAQVAEAQEWAAALHAAIAQLPEAQQQGLILRFWEHLSHAEVGKVVGDAAKGRSRRCNTVP